MCILQGTHLSSSASEGITFGFPAFLVIEAILNRASCNRFCCPDSCSAAQFVETLLLLQAWHRHHAAKAARMVDKVCETSFSAHRALSFAEFLTKAWSERCNCPCGMSIRHYCMRKARLDLETQGRHRPMFNPSHSSSSTTHTSPSTPRPDGVQQKV